MIGADWDIRPNGDVACSPLMGFQLAVLPTGGLVRLELVSLDDHTRNTALEAVQLAMTEPQLRELAAGLLRMADQILAYPDGTKQ